MKYLWVAVFFCIFAFLSAQERSDIKLYIAPTTGGSPDAREFFDVNIPAEIKGANYTITNEPEEADYLVSLTITEEEDSDIPFLFTLSVTKDQGSLSLVELSWAYTDVEEMYQWNLFLVYNALANIPLFKAPEEPTPAPEAAPEDDNPERTRWLFVGLRGGVSSGGYSFQLAPNYVSGSSTGIIGEGGLVVEFRLFRFLGFQVEVDFIYETFNAPTKTSSVDTFGAISLMIPLVVKVPLSFGRFTLSLYVGLYGTLGPWETEGVAIKTVIPLGPGFTMGTDVGFLVGPGELFADLRYGKDFGTTIIGDGAGPLYTRDRISVCLGYKFGF
jgi:hypothetical protein